MPRLARCHRIALCSTAQFIEEGNLTRNVSTLRKALGESPDGPRYIVTIPGRGYRFVAGVREVAVENGDSNSQAAVAPRASEAIGNSAGATEIAETRAGAGNKGSAAFALRISALVLIALAAAAAVYALFIREKRPSPHPAITSLVVLPLENLSGDPAQEYFADGMTDALIGDLAKIGALRVISRTSAMHYKCRPYARPAAPGPAICRSPATHRAAKSELNLSERR